MSTQHVETLVIGAGQAGLSTAYHLQRRGREVLVVDGDARVGDVWRQRYDSLRLFTPAKTDGLDGLPFPGDPWAFPTKDEMADYLELYAITHDLPVRLRTRIGRLSQEDGRFVAECTGAEASDSSHVITSDNVVVATGTFGVVPHVPGFAAEIDARIHQVHSGAYHGPVELPEGPALVVGASHSGLDIAYELGASRPTTLVGPARGVLPVEWGTSAMHAVFPFVEFAFRHVLTRRTPMGRKAMVKLRHHGAPQLRVKEHHLQERGVEWVKDHVTSISTDGLPQLGNGRTFEVSSVVWATGFRHDHTWLDMPLTIESGWPREYRGVVDEVPGLFFCGLAFQYAFSSGEMMGVGRDADYLAERIIARSRRPVPVG